ncbi:LPS assembly lipoprotein LptE [Archangium lansingense]|uniref:LPS assembly lipoprotein LptE n=1 Tax=Archangium lansingense TaxID=2995310 RepID=A0ABT4ADM6_9BACT|nr:LPS assembly lipoprotein LptE [Archangium lansinium]MCY1079760.1 LPS assembly lipoprotein LptE [Archangium lansinium]
MSRMRVVGWVLLLSAAGCGYRFTPRGTGLPGGVRSVCAPVFSNNTAEPGLELLFTRSMRQELVRAGVLGGTGACEATLEGVVLGVGSMPTAIAEPVFQGNTQSAPPQLASYRASATVLLQLKRDGQVVATAEVSGTEDFLPGTASVSGDVLEVEANRQSALHRLAETLMREGYDRLASSW